MSKLVNLLKKLRDKYQEMSEEKKWWIIIICMAIVFGVGAFYSAAFLGAFVATILVVIPLYWGLVNYT